MGEKVDGHMSSSQRSGYVLIEVIFVALLFSGLIALSNINVARPARTVAIVTTLDELVSEVSLARARAMNGDTQSGTGSSAYGVYIETGRYTIFRGASYNSAEATNFVITIPANISFSTIDLPSSTILFDSPSGEVSNYDVDARTMVLTDSVVGLSRTIQFNRYGVVESVL